MKKLELKSRSSKPASSKAGAVAPTKSNKPAVSPKDKKSALKSENKSAVKQEPSAKSTKSSPTNGNNALVKPSQAKVSKPPKDAKPVKAVKPKVLIQVVPKPKPSLPPPPAKSEKMLMRFGKPAKRVLFKVDFLLKASPTILYHFITTPSCLVRWFCDAVDITGEYYTFSWKGNTEVAELIDDIEDERLRFTWLDGEDDDEFFEYRFSIADITEETILEIYDFAWADEVEEQKQLWRTQIDRLRKETGDQTVS